MTRKSLGVALAIVIAASAGCVTKKKYEELQSQYDELNQRHQALQSSESGLRLQVSDLEEEIEILRDSNVYLGSFYTDLLNEFRPQLETDELQVIVYPDRMSLALAQDLTFATGSDRLTPEGRDAIQRMADFLKSHPERRFTVEGHTDSVPIANERFENNWELGAARAVAVVEELIAAGVPPEQLAASTYGEHSPLLANASDPGRAGNRRVEISFQPTLEELPGHQALLESAEVVRAEPQDAPPAPPPADQTRATPRGERASRADIVLERL